jgi:acylphosphatase
MKEARRLNARIIGRVQGVGFRYYAERQARRLSLTGWIQNLPDGVVEICAEGDEASLERLIDWCHEGPPSAAVTDVQVTWSDATAEFPDFRTRR